MKNILIITQRVNKNDDVLGFFHRWIEEFSRQCNRVTVICLEKGVYNFGNNVTVYSLGKETAPSRVRYLKNFYTYIWRTRHDYDAVFVHMNHEYVILGGLLWKLWRKRIALWYAHGHVSPSLRLAHQVADSICTSTASGFRIPSSKVRILGQGIDTDLFSPSTTPPSHHRIVSVGRLSPVKKYEVLVRAVAELARRGIRIPTTIIGGVGMTSQKAYADSLQHLATTESVADLVTFVGSKTHEEIVPMLQQSTMFVNTSVTGSLDKVGLEAMAVGLPVLTGNIAFKEVLGRYQDTCMYNPDHPNELVTKIEGIYTMPPDEYRTMQTYVRDVVVKNHTIGGLIQRILATLYDSRVY
jgi:glycosyltransferase involved in cell wall biosynthesis